MDQHSGEQPEVLELEGGGFKRFREFFQALSSSWIKVEVQQYYDETGSPGFDAFMRGDMASVRDLTFAMVTGQDVYDIAKRNGVSMTRIRIYDAPVSSYIKHYELYAYEADVEMGEDIRFISSHLARQLYQESTIPFEDFLLFDAHCAVVLSYNESGKLLAAKAFRSPDAILRFERIARELVAQSVPMQQSSLYRDQRGRKGVSRGH